MEPIIKAIRQQAGLGLVQASWRLFPARCLVCAGVGAEQRDLCTACERDLPCLDEGCQCCAEPLSKPGLCGRCLRAPPYYERVRVPFAYRPPLDRLIQSFKFDAKLEAGRLLAELLADFLADSLAEQDRPQCLLPVPLHIMRLRERGFNQALELAKPLARKLNLPLLPNTLVRLRDTPQQSQLKLTQRQRNIRGAFRLRRALAVNHVALIDDVMSSGSTVGEIARVLRTAGVARVQVWVCARAVLD